MANKRMFNMKIVDSDAFLDMPLSTQCLYFHLNMRADDDGFVGNPKKIQRLIGSSEDDLKLLIAKRFLLVFEDGVIVIKHWRMHNTIRKDRYTQTSYVEELNQLKLKKNNSYTFSNDGIPVGIPNGNQMATNGIPIGTTDIGLDIGIDIDKDLKEKDKKEKETYVSIVSRYTQNLDLSNSLKDFVEMRKKMKGFTTRALELALNKLDQLASDDETKIKIVNQSVENSWKSFYELKNSNKSKITELPNWYHNQDLAQEEVSVDDEELKKLQEQLGG